MSDKMIRVDGCMACPFVGRDVDVENKCTVTGELIEDELFFNGIIPDDCPLEDVSDDDLTTAYMIGYEKAKDEYKSRWRKYPDEKPNKDGLYLVIYNKKSYAFFNWFTKTDNWEEFYNAGADFDIVVNHWMPISEVGE